MYDVVALGELLIDFTSCQSSQSSNPVFEANPGGAPCNVLAMLAQLGKNTAFIGKVGEDMFGLQLKEALENANISCEGLVLDKKFNTTLAFVNNLPDGDRQFSFYRTDGADTHLSSDEIKANMIISAKLFHFGSLSLTHTSAREATHTAIQIAKDNKVLVSFDPNLREVLWSNLDIAKQQILWGMQHCHVLKLSKEELAFVTNKADVHIAAKEILALYNNIKLLLITDGKHGSYGFYNDTNLHCPASAHKAIDTTGAGDTFFACCLNKVLETGLDNLTTPILEEMLRFASTAAGIITTRKGAMALMPSVADIMQSM